MTRKTRSTIADGLGEEGNDIENENPQYNSKFQWIGSGARINRVMHYGKCDVNGVVVEVGGNVEIMLEKSYAIAEVQDLYETFGQDPYRAKVRWYYPFKDLPKKFKAQVTDQTNPKELFKPKGGFFLGSEEDIDVETVSRSVTVWPVGEDDVPPPDDFFVRYCFPTNKGEKQLLPILGEANVPPKYKLECMNEDEGDEEESEDQEVVINFTQIRGKKDTTKDTSGHEKPLKENFGDPADKCAQSSDGGTLKKNAMKWKNFNADEVLAEIWNTDGDSGTNTASSTTKKRKLDEATSKVIHPKNEKDTDRKTVSTTSPHKVQDKTALTRESNNVKLKRDNVHINKTASPFRSIPKKKEQEKDGVFDFDEEIGSSPPSPKPTRSRKSPEDQESVSKNKNNTTVGCVPKAKKSLPMNEKGKTPNSTKVKTKNEATPGISDRKTPRAAAKSMLEMARKRLHVSAVPETLPCRDDQFSQIFSFVQDRLKEGTGGCMYISGVPGTGKTATVREVVRTLRESMDDSVIPSFKFVEINGMKLTDPNHAYTEIYKALEGKKVTPDHASDLLSERFRSSTAKNDNVVILVDELDLLCTRKQNVMYNIFDWPTGKHSKLVVLAVANTMDLPERMMMNRVSSRLGLTRMTFQPYTFKELEEIVLSRIRGTNAFEDDALQLVARKVAAVSGDARRCLDICRRAVEISENNVPSKKGSGCVGMKHVDLALKEMFSSPKIIALQCLSDMEVMLMKAVISEFRRTGLEEAIFLEIYDQFKSHCALEDGITPPNMSEAFTICNNLGSCRLLLVEAGNKDVHQRVRLNVNVDDAMFAFKSRGS